MYLGQVPEIAFCLYTADYERRRHKVLKERGHFVARALRNRDSTLAACITFNTLIAAKTQQQQHTLQ